MPKTNPFSAWLGAAMLTGCGPGALSQPELDPASVERPDMLPDTPDELDNTPQDNPTTVDGATLGRVLFYDTRLSASGTVACASCHLQENAFSDPDRFSLGHEGERTGRNSMSLVNVRLYPSGRMFWDERAASLEEQVLLPIQDSIEMGLTLDELEDVVASAPEYGPLFDEAFGDDAVSSDRISRALAQFVRTMVSLESRYDIGLAAAPNPGANFANFTAAENRGKTLFFGRAGCAACHVAGAGPGGPGPGGEPSVFFINGPANNGVDDGSPDDDPGVGAITGRAQDVGKMKSPSLRNVAVTGPYMHDGRFASLARVVRFYNAEVQPHPNLDPRLRAGPNGPPRRLGLNGQEQADLVAFMETLTDEAFLDDARFADPFLGE